MASTSKSKRSELKENILAQKLENLLIWGMDHKPIVMAIVGGFLGAILIGLVLITQNKEARETNWTRLSQAQAYLSQGLFDQSQEILTDIKTKYPTSDVGIHANYYFGQLDLQRGNYDEAIKTFSEVAQQTAGTPLRPLAITNEAYAYEAKGDFENAAETYQSFMNEYAEHFLAPRNQLNMGRCYFMAGNTTEAEESLGQLIDLYPTSSWAQNAREIMDKIETR